MSYRKMKLEEIGKIVSGATPKTSTQDNFGGDIAWITPADLSGYTKKYISHGKRNITEMGYNSCSTQLMPKGSVLFSSRAPIGYVAIAENPLCTNQGFKSIVPNDLIDSEFLYYQLKYLSKSIQDKGTGTTFKEISAKTLGKIEIVVPLLSEQKNIVSRIEELFSKLDKGVETLQTIKQQLAVYRQAVLTEAFEGIENTVELGSIASIVDPHPSHRTPVEVIGGVPYIGVGDIDYVHHVIDFSSSRKVSNDILQDHLSRYTLHDGDFIMGKIGTIGKPFIIALPQNYTLSANVILIQPNKKVVIPKYLFWQVSSSQITKQLLEGSTSTTQPAFGIKKARLLSIKICSLEEQNRIVQKIESHLSLCDDIGQSVTAALSQAEAMRQSILKQAFEGKL